MKKLIYKGKNKVRLLVPFDKVINNGDKIEVTNAQAESLLLAGFELVEEPKEKKEDKKEANK